MCKKLPLSLVIALFAFATYGQTIVSTSPENKNVVLEEFTGIHCVFCPDGHAIAKSIQDANPDRVSLVNIHTGGYANPGAGEPDFRTPYGAAIAAQTGLTGYPSGTVNRHVFVGGKTILDRGQWASRANQTMAAASNVNVGVEASIDINTSVLTIHVQGYYTSNSPESTNLLNVALLQNNTKGPQTGGGQGNNYNHMHRLVDMITGQWGEEITTTTTGTLVDRTFTYPIPVDFNGVPTELVDMEVVAFITDTHQEIPSGSRVLPEFTGLVNANDASIRSVTDFPKSCETELTPEISIQNLGQNPITALAIEYTVNGEAHTYNWTGNLGSLRSETVELPTVPFVLQGLNTVVVTLPSDDNNSNNSVTKTFNQAPVGSGIVYMELQVDNNGSQTRWYVTNSSGTVLYHGGPYPNGNPQVINETFTLTADCYSFRVLDIPSNGGGEITLTDHHSNQLYHTDGNYGNGETAPFGSNGVLGVTQNQLDNVSLYPNPASKTINVKNAENANVQVFDVLGKLILSQSNISMDAQLNVSQLQAGTYFMKISKDNLITTKKFLVVN
ncbi:Outer membrane protein Omp28 [Aequorivita sublithincola DSM 14238]|uniref:Outer membrane protein Omp28 n=1 Tax=Aequorivita sublithincola (strain DSM 14238 / LMG 21431 / ACAM 643 / 9-3) TaxID=746697 RepID=I3YSQ9_AEQSU|nr:Omp28-related outer membrane protein [Aequorivita sublithincola]AFL80027.1 Outer membrane protein Omp28 [Aequorivita sublithincola DSM 14238]